MGGSESFWNFLFRIFFLSQLFQIIFFWRKLCGYRTEKIWLILFKRRSERIIGDEKVLYFSCLKIFLKNILKEKFFILVKIFVFIFFLSKFPKKIFYSKYFFYLLNAAKIGRHFFSAFFFKQNKKSPFISLKICFEKKKIEIKFEG